jgi:hypothetical protein
MRHQARTTPNESQEVIEETGPPFNQSFELATFTNRETSRSVLEATGTEICLFLHIITPFNEAIRVRPYFGVEQIV